MCPIFTGPVTYKNHILTFQNIFIRMFDSIYMVINTLKGLVENVDNIMYHME